MKIAINGYHLRKNLTGIGNFTLFAMQEMAKRSEYEMTFYCNPLISDDVLSLIPQNIKVVKSKPGNDLIWLMTKLPKMINKQKPELFWNPSPLEPFGISRKIKRLIIVYDFVYTDYPETMTWKGLRIMQILAPKAIKKADFLWAISDFTKQRLCTNFPNRKQNNVFVGGAASEIYYPRPSDQNTKAKYKITKPYLLFAGTREPRKNLKYMLELFREIHKVQNLQLVISGSSGWGKTDIAKVMEEPDYPKLDVIITGFVSNDELLELYYNAECYISTAYYEGLGLPQLEAMACSCPVISQENSAMTEVVKDAGILVQGWKYKDWISAIKNTMFNRAQIIDNQNKKLQQYKWDKIIDNLGAYLKVKNQGNI